MLGFVAPTQSRETILNIWSKIPEINIKSQNEILWDKKHTKKMAAKEKLI